MKSNLESNVRKIKIEDISENAIIDEEHTFFISYSFNPEQIFKMWCHAVFCDPEYVILLKSTRERILKTNFQIYLFSYKFHEGGNLIEDTLQVTIL
jgi:hypothetical protein